MADQIIDVVLVPVNQSETFVPFHLTPGTVCDASKLLKRPAGGPSIVYESGLYSVREDLASLGMPISETQNAAEKNRAKQILLHEGLMAIFYLFASEPPRADFNARASRIMGYHIYGEVVFKFELSNDRVPYKTSIRSLDTALLQELHDDLLELELKRKAQKQEEEKQAKERAQHENSHISGVLVSVDPYLEPKQDIKKVDVRDASLFYIRNSLSNPRQIIPSDENPSSICCDCTIDAVISNQHLMLPGNYLIAYAFRSGQIINEVASSILGLTVRGPVLFLIQHNDEYKDLTLEQFKQIQSAINSYHEYNLLTYDEMNKIYAVMDSDESLKKYCGNRSYSSRPEIFLKSLFGCFPVDSNVRYIYSCAGMEIDATVAKILEVIPTRRRKFQ